MKPRRATFQCAHCEYRDALAARVQGHCLAKHPSKPVRYRRLDEEDTSEMVATGGLAEVKIESVESLAFGQEFFPTPDTGKSTRSQDAGTYGDMGGRNLQVADAVVEGGRVDGGSAEFLPFMCRYCPESAWTEDLIRSHLASVHADRPPQFGVVQVSLSSIRFCKEHSGLKVTKAKYGLYIHLYSLKGSINVKKKPQT